MQEKILSLIKELVRIPSVSIDKKELHAIIEYIQELFDGYEHAHIEVRAYNDKPSLIIQNFSGKTADIVLSGHLDVVPAQSKELFEPREEDGRLYGRGCGDMKDGCAIIILLMKELLEKKYIDKKISLRLTTDEETGGTDGVGALVRDGYGGNVVLIPDAGDYTYVTYASKGIITADVEVIGKAAHSSRPWKGDNALEKLYVLYTTIKNELEEPEILYDTPEHWSTSVQLTKAHGGTASNVLPERALGTINIRFTEQYTQDNILACVEKICGLHDASILSYESGPLMHTNPDSPILKQFRDVVTDVTGQQPSLDKEHGTTDGRYFPEETTVLLYQPTDNNIHTAGEYTTIDQLEDVYNIYKLFVTQSTL